MYFYEINKGVTLEDAGDIAAHIRSSKETPRICKLEKEELVDIRAKIEKHIKNTYLKRLNAPIGIKAKLSCWMEIN